jgi:hypothetical protein
MKILFTIKWVNSGFENAALMMVYFMQQFIQERY